jgi:hypothetical protein
MLVSPALILLLGLQGPRAYPAGVQHATDNVPPLIAGKPVEVTVGFEVVDFARITSRDESFEVTGYLEVSWLDPALGLPESERTGKGELRPIDSKAIWTPRVFFDNALEQPKFHHDPVVEVDEKGTVWSWVIVSGKFSAPFDLREFPFDRQRLPVRVAAFDDESVMRFIVNPNLVVVNSDAFVTDWTILSPAARAESHRYVPGQANYSRFVYSIDVQRKATFYVWRVLLPLTLLAMIAFVSFWFEPIGLQPQISTCMASLIALVAFNFAIDFSLPKVAYLTLIDKHALIGFVGVSVAVVVVALVHQAVTKGKIDRAHAIQRLARLVFPAAYVVALLLNLFVLR